MIEVSPKKGEQIAIGNDIIVRVINDSPEHVRLEIVAPDHVNIVRGGLPEQPPDPAATEQRPISPITYLKSMLTIACSAFLHPNTTTVVDLDTGKAVNLDH